MLNEIFYIREEITYADYQSITMTIFALAQKSLALVQKILAGMQK